VEEEDIVAHFIHDLLEVVGRQEPLGLPVGHTVADRTTEIAHVAGLDLKQRGIRPDLVRLQSPGQLGQQPVSPPSPGKARVYEVDLVEGQYQASGEEGTQDILQSSHVVLPCSCFSLSPAASTATYAGRLPGIVKDPISYDKEEPPASLTGRGRICNREGTHPEYLRPYLGSHDPGALYQRGITGEAIHVWSSQVFEWRMVRSGA
jgi:hypothetical protein